MPRYPPSAGRPHREAFATEPHDTRRSGDSVWALAAGRARGLLVRHATVRNRIGGGVLIAAAVALAAARGK